MPWFVPRGSNLSRGPLLHPAGTLFVPRSPVRSFYPCSCPSSCFSPRLLSQPRPTASVPPGSISAPLQSCSSSAHPNPALSSPVQLCPSTAQLKLGYGASANFQPSPPPANPCHVPVQPSLALVLLQPPALALLWHWPGAAMIRFGLLQSCSRLFQPCSNSSQSHASSPPSPNPDPPSPLPVSPSPALS